jgi:hypothetical protein
MYGKTPKRAFNAFALSGQGVQNRHQKRDRFCCILSCPKRAAKKRKH